ncbi:hypothetical protein [Brumicola nitratireducens]|nr:hypothetical protein [Glaciecola nitratireducens]
MYKHIESKPSFKDFYSHPNRVNLYSKLFTNMKLDSIGLIAIDTCVVKSLLLAEDWLDIEIGRFRYEAITARVNVDISADDFNNITALHAADIALFNEAKKIFVARWEQLINKKQCITHKNKKLVIHVGPPKTGTSAIQYWFKKNRESLISEGILYPEHNLDGNNISSGNVDCLITNRTESESAHYDHSKARKVMQELNDSTADMLLLSSEHFFYYLPWLFAYLPNAEFIFYVRHPLSALESGYHQQVKRHKYTRPFAMPSKISFQQLDILTKMAKEFSPKLLISYFDEKLFHNGSLINDFLHLLPKKSNITANVERINSQYCHEAIELMRFCNHFASNDLLARLDKFLQEYSQSQPSFSYITKTDVNNFSSDMQHQAKLLAKQVPQLRLEKMMQIITNYAPRENEAQHEELDFSDIIAKLKSKDLLLVKKLIDEIDNKYISEHFSIVELLALTIKEKLLLKARKVFFLAFKSS